MRTMPCATLALSIITCHAAFAASASASSRSDLSNQAPAIVMASEPVPSQIQPRNDPATVKLEQRLAQLKSQLAAGQKYLAELEAKAADTRQTLQRISGAIKVLEEELAKSKTPQK